MAHMISMDQYSNSELSADPEIITVPEFTLTAPHLRARNRPKRRTQFRWTTAGERQAALDLVVARAGRRQWSADLLRDFKEAHGLR